MVVVSVRPKQNQKALAQTSTPASVSASQQSQPANINADNVSSYAETGNYNSNSAVKSNDTPDKVSEPTLVYQSTNPSASFVLPISAEESALAQSVEDNYSKPAFDRVKILDEINKYNLITYEVRTVRTYDYLRSLFSLAHLLSQTKIYCDAVTEVHKDICQKIHTYAEHLRNTGKYDEMSQKVLEIKLTKKGFDATTGEAIEDSQQSLFTSSNADLERQFRQADVRLYNEGVCYRYGELYANIDDEDAFRIEFVLYVGSDDCMKNLEKYAEDKFNEFHKKYRFGFSKQNDTNRQKFDKIVSDSDDITDHMFSLPEDIIISEDVDGDSYTDHLYVGNNGSIKIKLNSWEKPTLEEEQKKEGFICWLRNIERKPWALKIPYTINNVVKPMYPDFLIFRRESDGSFRISILEPHGAQYSDSLPKAKGLAKYAEKNHNVGSVQLIHVEKDKATGKQVCRRLELTDRSVMNKVLLLNTNQELNNLFLNDGFVE